MVLTNPAGIFAEIASHAAEVPIEEWPRLGPSVLHAVLLHHHLLLVHHHVMLLHHVMVHHGLLHAFAHHRFVLSDCRCCERDQGKSRQHETNFLHLGLSGDDPIHAERNSKNKVPVHGAIVSAADLDP